MRKFQELPVYRQSHSLVLDIYKATNNFPVGEKFGLTSQLRRSVTSIPANIVEGLHRNTIKELISFLYNARGSAGECLYHLLLAKDLKYLDSSVHHDLDERLQTVIKQLNGWIKSEKKKLNIKN